MYAIGVPATTEAGPVLVIDRSADAVRSVLFASSFASTGSSVAASTDAEFTIVPAPPGVSIRITIPGATPTGSDPRVHVTIPEASSQIHPDPAADTKAEPGGSSSVTTRSSAPDGPALLTRSV